jgi:BolA protein
MIDRRIELMREKLAVLAPTKLEIINESHKHVGHVGSQGGAGHYAMTISADIFKNKPSVASHRLIYDALGEMMGPEIHALRIKII